MSAAPAVRFRQLIENLLIHLSWFDAARDELNLTGVSQIWDEEPAWYFWLDKRGYLLRYANLPENSPDELTAILHAFPTRKEWDEGRVGDPLLTAEHFDFSTMTPRFESFALFKETFIAGEMTFALADGELQLLAASGHDDAWENLWTFTEFLVAMMVFRDKALPGESPCFFHPAEKISSVLVPFVSSGAAMVRAIVAADPCHQLPVPLRWRRLARQEFHCSAEGICTCSHEH